MNSARYLIEALESRTLLSSTVAGIDYGTAVLDPGFGKGGLVTGYGNAISVQSDGKIIAHQIVNGSEVLVRLNPDGTLDKTFNPATYTPRPSGLVQSNGKRLVVSSTNDGGDILTRYNVSGSIDKTFGVNGSVTDKQYLQTPTRGITNSYDPPARAFGNFIAKDFALQGDSILVAGDLSGYTTTGDATFGYNAPSFQRLTPDGKIDKSFGLVVAVVSPNSYEDTIHSGGIVVTKNQIFLFAGEFDYEDYYIYRFDTHGNPADSSRSGEFYSGAASPDGTLNMLIYGQYASFTEFPTFAQMAPGATSYFQITLNHEEGKVLPSTVLVEPDGTILAGVADFTDYADDSHQPIILNLLRFLPLHTTPTGDVSGFLYNDTNSNGKRDASEAPLRYWQAYADINNNGVFDLGEPTAYADYNGYYRIRGLTPGKYVIREVRQAGWRRTSPAGDWPLGSYSVNVTANHVVTANDFGNTTLALISGTVFYDQNQNHKQDAGDHLHSGVVVYIDANNNGKLDAGEKSTTTDIHGTYSFTLSPGTYRVRVVLKAGSHFTTPATGVYLLTLASGDLKTGEIFGDH